MQIHSIQFLQIGIPLNFRFSQANNSGTSTSASAIVTITTADGVKGYGESCPRSYVTGESMADVAGDIAALEDEIILHPVSSTEELRQKLQEWAGRGIGTSTRCAFELAWLDAWSRTQGKSLRELLQISHQQPISYSMVLPLVSSSALAKLLEKLLHFQPPAIKLKVDADQQENLARIGVLRQHFGAELPIRVDVNNGWTLDQARSFIPQFLDQGIRSFEQPLDPADLRGMQQLTQAFGSETSIMADESLLNPERAEYLLDHCICNHFNLKISKLGGLFSSLEVYQIAADRGMPCQLGAHFGETSLLSSAGALLAGVVAGQLSACEGALGEFLLSADICAPGIQQDLQGKLDLNHLWAGPGLVENIRIDKLSEFSISC